MTVALLSMAPWPRGRDYGDRFRAACDHSDQPSVVPLCLASIVYDSPRPVRPGDAIVMLVRSSDSPGVVDYRADPWSRMTYWLCVRVRAADSRKGGRDDRHV